MCRELTRDERKGIRKLVTEMCANYDRGYGCLPQMPGPHKILRFCGERRCNEMSELCR